MQGAGVGVAADGKSIAATLTQQRGTVTEQFATAPERTGIIILGPVEQMLGGDAGRLRRQRPNHTITGMSFRRAAGAARLTEWTGGRKGAVGSVRAGRLRGAPDTAHRRKEPLHLRTIIVHYHIFKNAGSSVDRLLNMAFGDGWGTLEGPTPTSLLRPHDLSAFIKDHPEIVAVSSHLLRPPAPPDVRVFPVVLIRHPLDRAFSVYNHLRRHHDGASTGTVAQRASFSQFVLWCLDNKTRGGMVIADYQVIHLSPASFRNGHIYQAVATENDLLHAIHYLSDGACFGTVDLFDAAMDRLRQAAAAIDLNIPASTIVENVTPGRLEDLDERLDVATRLLGPGLHRRYMDENELDYRLYEWARASQAAASATLRR